MKLCDKIGFSVSIERLADTRADVCSGRDELVCQNGLVFSYIISLQTLIISGANAFDFVSIELSDAVPQ